MKIFISRVLGFGFGLLLINIPLFFIVDKEYYSNYNKVELNYDTYILSDSHGSPLDNYTEEYGIYNFSAPSDSYYDMLRKMNFLIRNTQVKRIILTADDHGLSEHREKLNNLDRSNFLVSLVEYSNIFEYIRNKYQYYFVLLNSKDRDIVIAYLRSRLITRKKNTPSIKWADLPTSKQKENSMSKVKTEFLDNQKSSSLHVALQDIILLCKQHHVEIIGIKFPLSNEYIKAMENKSYHADSVFIKQNLKVFDFKYLYRHDDSYFSNEDHLNELGGKEFAKILGMKYPMEKITPLMGL